MTTGAPQHRRRRAGEPRTPTRSRILMDAATRAQVEIDVLYAGVAHELDAELGQLREAALQAARWPADGDARVEVFWRARAVAELAELCRSVEIAAIARRLGELTERNIERHLWEPSAIAAHVDAMTLLRLYAGGVPPADRQRILEGLDAVGAPLAAPIPADHNPVPREAVDR